MITIDGKDYVLIDEALDMIHRATDLRMSKNAFHIKTCKGVMPRPSRIRVNNRALYEKTQIEEGILKLFTTE